MKRIYLFLAFLTGFAVINGYTAGGKDQSIDEHIAEINEMSMKVDELEREQKALKEELEKSKRDMDGLARKLESLVPGFTMAAASNEGSVVSASSEGPVVAASILQGGVLTQSAVTEYMQKYSRPPAWFTKDDISVVVSAYFRIAEIEGVNPDIALAQVWYATQSLTHSTLLRHCNYANLEPITDVEGVNDWDGVFPNTEAGVKAHIQHLKAYAEAAFADSDPRYKILEINGFLGKGDTLAKLCAMWTKDDSGKYEDGLNEILKSFYQYQKDY